MQSQTTEKSSFTEIDYDIAALIIDIGEMEKDLQVGEFQGYARRAAERELAAMKEQLVELRALRRQLAIRNAMA